MRNSPLWLYSAVSSRLAARVLSLPMGADLSVGDQDRVVEALVAALRAGPS